MARRPQIARLLLSTTRHWRPEVRLLICKNSKTEQVVSNIALFQGEELFIKAKLRQPPLVSFSKQLRQTNMSTTIGLLVNQVDHTRASRFNATDT
jgi:hypothetical protein